MAVKTWFVTSSLASTHQQMDETDPGTEAFASPTTGWIVSTTGTGTAPFDAQTEQAATTFTGGPHPDGSINTTLGDCLRTTNTYKGNFANANWTVNFCSRSVTSVAATGRIGVRLFRSANADGTGATQITSAIQIGSTITASTTVTQNSTIAFNPGAFSITNEYIFVQIGWERLTAAAMTTADINMRIGNSASLGTRVVSADFTSTVNDLLDVDLAVGAPVQSTPTFVATSLLAADNLEVVAPTEDAADLVQLTSVTVVMSSFAIDNGLDSFIDADQILVCSATPTSYANALTVKLGGQTFGQGNTFSAPQNASPSGRKVTSTAITAGTMTATGTPTCWAAIDSVNSQLLASGVFLGGVAATTGQQFSLDSFAIHTFG